MQKYPKGMQKLGRGIQCIKMGKRRQMEATPPRLICLEGVFFLTDLVFVSRFAEIISIPLGGEGELDIRAPFDQVAAEVA